MHDELEGWSTNGKEISKKFPFKDFAEAIAFANKIAALAEEENHHPDLLISWGKVVVTLSTHSLNNGVGGLSEKDFSLARKIDTI